ncbi:hypothetical protein [Pseudomonas sp. R1-15]|uniref:hypothetical protein n=1 Tax=Pseudomonas sp. R1-15 TaxID=2817399 RepID=UPI003DA91E71
MPTAQCLRSASVVNGAPEINVHREAAFEPTWFWLTVFILWETPVGASLLAMAVAWLMKMLDVPAYSRAGSLPQLALRSAMDL